MKRILTWLAFALAAVVVLAAAGWWWLTGTQSGAAFLVGQAQARLERLEYRSLQGDLGDGVVLGGVDFAHAGLSARFERIELVARARLWPPRLTVDRLRIDHARVALPPAPEQAEAAAFTPGDYRLPVEIVIGQLDIADLSLQTAPETEPLVIERIELAGRIAEVLELDSLRVVQAPWTVDAAGRVGLARPWAASLDLALDWRLGDQAGDRVDDQLSQRLEVGISGAADALELTLAARGPLTGNAQVRLDDALATLDGSGTPDADLRLDVSLAGWPGMPARVDGLRLEAGGAPDDWRAELGVEGISWPGWPVAGISLAANGAGERIKLTRGRIDVLDGRIDITGQGRIALPGSRAPGEPANASARVRFAGLDFTALYPDWPDQARLEGSLTAAWDGRRLALEDLALAAPPAPLEVAGRATLDTVRQALTVAVDWQSLVWPPVLDGREPMFSSESGRLEASGTLADWRAEVAAWLAVPGQPRARLELDAGGDARGVDIRTGRVAFDRAGVVTFSGRVVHAAPVSANLELGLDGLDPGAFVTELPGTVDGQLGVKLESLDPFAGTLDVRRLAGTLRQVPLAGTGGLSARDGRIERADLELSLGANRLSVNSTDGAAWRLALAAERLDQLWPQLAGGATMTATVQPDRQRAEWSGNSPGIAWLDFRTRAIETRGSLDWGPEPALDARLSAVDVDLNPWERLDRVEFEASGNCRFHQATAAVTGTRADIELAVSGRLPGCLEAPAGWAGHIDRLVVGQTAAGTWQLVAAVPVGVRDGSVQAGPGCLWTTGGSGRLCLNRLEGGKAGRVELAFNSVPADLLLLPIDPVFTLGSDLRGLARVGWTGAGIRNLDATVLLGAGAARMLGSQEDLVRVRGARLDLVSPRPGAVDAELDLRLEQQSRITARAGIPDLTAPDAMRLDAEANLDLPNLAAFNRLVPQLDRMAGRLHAEARLSGPLAAPDFTGRIAIEQGGFVYAPLGARIEALDLELTADEGGGRLDGGFVAGDGRAEIAGRLDLDAAGGWRANASITGQQLKMFDVDWLQMIVSPDLAVALRPDRLDLDGELAIDRARLGMPPGTASRVPVSPDVVVVGAEDSPDGGAASPPPREIAGNVRIELGDDARISAAGLEAKLAGALDVAWSPGEPLPSGRGTVRLVDGAYSAYGQNLEVTEGDILFTGRPIDNPVLEIEAVREIFGDPQVEQAGVRIRGPARNPEITLFTAPPTSREQALAYILTGAEFDRAAGQGAFSVGFWVLPRVFVSYGVGLFDAGNVLATRWELSRRWGLRATSGDRDTGIDVSFIIDR